MLSVKPKKSPQTPASSPETHDHTTVSGKHLMLPPACVACVLALHDLDSWINPDLRAVTQRKGDVVG